LTRAVQPVLLNRILQSCGDGVLNLIVSLLSYDLSDEQCAAVLEVVFQKKKLQQYCLDIKFFHELLKLRFLSTAHEYRLSRFVRAIFSFPESEQLLQVLMGSGNLHDLYRTVWVLLRTDSEATQLLSHTTLPGAVASSIPNLYLVHQILNLFSVVPKSKVYSRSLKHARLFSEKIVSSLNDSVRLHSVQQNPHLVQMLFSCAMPVLHSLVLTSKFLSWVKGGLWSVIGNESVLPVAAALFIQADPDEFQKLVGTGLSPEASGFLQRLYRYLAQFRLQFEGKSFLAQFDTVAVHSDINVLSLLVPLAALLCSSSAIPDSQGADFKVLRISSAVKLCNTAGTSDGEAYRLRIAGLKILARMEEVPSSLTKAPNFIDVLANHFDVEDVRTADETWDLAWILLQSRTAQDALCRNETFQRKVKPASGPQYEGKLLRVFNFATKVWTEGSVESRKAFAPILQRWMGRKLWQGMNGGVVDFGDAVLSQAFNRFVQRMKILNDEKSDDLFVIDFCKKAEEMARRG
jgi:hypothetical protein